VRVHFCHDSHLPCTYNMPTHTDECQLHQCALKPLECIRSNWSNPASGAPLYCASLNWRPRHLEETASPDTQDANAASNSSANGTNGSSHAVVVAKPKRGGLLVHDPPCDDHAQWLASFSLRVYALSLLSMHSGWCWVLVFAHKVFADVQVHNPSCIHCLVS
jgi:hypothetical protein